MNNADMKADELPSAVVEDLKYIHAILSLIRESASNKNIVRLDSSATLLLESAMYRAECILEAI